MLLEYMQKCLIIVYFVWSIGISGLAEKSSPFWQDKYNKNHKSKKKLYRFLFLKYIINNLYLKLILYKGKTKKYLKKKTKPSKRVKISKRCYFKLVSTPFFGVFLSMFVSFM